MVDIHTKEQRSYNMSRVKCKDTKPEVQFRKYLFNKGLRGYRTQAKLPGKPDIIFRKQKVAIFIDGCFWHKCPKCFSPPKSNVEFWTKKINGNVQRDKHINKILSKEGYVVLRFWTHEIKEDSAKCFNKVYKSVKKNIL